jgi:hypothetical protein
MAVLYVALGIILGGISAVVIMAMFFVAKRADEDHDQMSNTVTRNIKHQEIPSSSCDL